MELTNDIGDILDDYYGTNQSVTQAARTHPAPALPCNNSTEFKRWGNPYDLQEFIYWVFKMLVLPGLVIYLIFSINILQTFENPVFGIISSILGPIAGIFIYIMAKESARAIQNRISNNQLVQSGVPLNKLDHVDFKIGFVGDIMMMNEHDLRFDPEV